MFSNMSTRSIDPAEVDVQDPYGLLDAAFPTAPAETATEATVEAAPPANPQSEHAKRLQSDKVYTVASDQTIKTLMSEYKKRKQAHSMPTFVRAQRSRPLPPKVKKTPSADPIDREIQDQQTSSIMKVGRSFTKCFFFFPFFWCFLFLFYANIVCLKIVFNLRMAATAAMV